MPETSRDTVIEPADCRADTRPSNPPITSAQAIPVHYGDVLLTGWAIKQDTVLVEAGGLTNTTEVTVNGVRVVPEAAYEIKRDINGWQPLTALVLPPDTLEVLGEAFPPGFTPPVQPGTPARFTFWCMLFPRMRGC